MNEEWYSFKNNPRTSGATLIATLDDRSYSQAGIGGKNLAMAITRSRGPAVWAQACVLFCDWTPAGNLFRSMLCHFSRKCRGVGEARVGAGMQRSNASLNKAQADTSAPLRRRLVEQHSPVAIQADRCDSPISAGRRSRSDLRHARELVSPLDRKQQRRSGCLAGEANAQVLARIMFALQPGCLADAVAMRVGA